MGKFVFFCSSTCLFAPLQLPRPAGVSLKLSQRLQQLQGNPQLVCGHAGEWTAGRRSSPFSPHSSVFFLPSVCFWRLTPKRKFPLAADRLFVSSPRHTCTFDGAFRACCAVSFTDVGSVLRFSGTSAVNILAMKMTDVTHTFLMKLFLKSRQNELLFHQKGKSDIYKVQRCCVCSTWFNILCPLWNNGKFLSLYLSSRHRSMKSLLWTASSQI